MKCACVKLCVFNVGVPYMDLCCLTAEMMCALFCNLLDLNPSVEELVKHMFERGCDKKQRVLVPGSTDARHEHHPSFREDGTK